MKGIEYRENKLEGFYFYYENMIKYGDCDPSYPAMRYIADRLELNLEQRYWLAFLYGTNYCAPTSYYILNEFPDYENVNLQRMENWWNNNKQKTIFQTDRQKVKSFNLFTKVFESYKNLIGNSQVETFSKFLKIENLEERYDSVYKFAGNIYYFGRFSLFNYLESLNELTNLKLEPSTLNLKEADSCRNGLCYILNKEDWVKKKGDKKKFIGYDYLQKELKNLKNNLILKFPEINVTYFNIETCLCGYKKLFWDKRYLGYYIDRMMEEIYKIQDLVDKGVDWSILWDFRKEYFSKNFLGELNDWNKIRQKKMGKIDINKNKPKKRNFFDF